MLVNQRFTFFCFIFVLTIHFAEGGICKYIIGKTRKKTKNSSRPNL